MAEDQRAKVIVKIARLKALAECKTGNKNEAATAAALMQRLMLEHRIESEELSRVTDNGVMREPLGLRDKSFPPWKQHLITNLAKHNGCTYQTLPNEETMPICLVLTVGELERLVNAADNRLVDKTCCEATDCVCMLEEMKEEEYDQCNDRQTAEQEQLAGARSKIVSWVREALKRTWMPDQRLDKVVTWTCKVHDPVTGAECGHVNHTSISQAAIPDCDRCKFSKYVSDCAGATG